MSNDLGAKNNSDSEDNPNPKRRRSKRNASQSGAAHRSLESVEEDEVSVEADPKQLTGSEEALLLWDNMLAASTDRDNLGLHGHRPPTWLSGVQGAHATAYGLIRRALSNVFSSIREGDNAYSEKWLKERRDRLLQFVDQLLFLGSEDNESKQQVKEMIVALMARYDVTRSRKTGLKIEYRSNLTYSSLVDRQEYSRQKIKEILQYFETEHKSGSVDQTREEQLRLLARVFSNRLVVGDKRALEDRLFKSFMDGMTEDKSQSEKTKIISDILQREKLDDHSVHMSVYSEHGVKNARLIEEMCRHITIHALRFYNKLEGVAFYHTAESKVKRDGKMYEGPALDALDSDISHLSKEGLINAIDGLLDYKKTTSSIQSGKGNRTNDISLLIEVSARHLFLFFSAYPQAALKYGVDIFNFKKGGSSDLDTEIIKPFLAGFLSKDWTRVIPKQKGSKRMSQEQVIEKICDKFSDMAAGSSAQAGIMAQAGLDLTSDDSSGEEQGDAQAAAAVAVSASSAAPADSGSEREKRMVEQAVKILCEPSSSQLVSENLALRQNVSKLENELKRLKQLLPNLGSESEPKSEKGAQSSEPISSKGKLSENGMWSGRNSPRRSAEDHSQVATGRDQGNYGMKR